MNFFSRLFKRFFSSKEERKARIWLENELETFYGYRKRLAKQLLDCYLNKQPLCEMPLYREHLKRVQEQQARKQEEKRNREAWLQFAKTKVFKVDGYRVTLVVDCEDVKVDILENFEVALTFHNQRRIIPMQRDQIKIWTEQVRKVVAESPKKFEISIGTVDFDAFTAMFPSYQGGPQMGSITEGPTVKLLLRGSRN